MKGTIRLFLGFMLAFGAVGGMEHQPDASLTLQILIAVLGLFLMLSGAKAIDKAG